jgi:hypothetical protein
MTSDLRGRRSKIEFKGRAFVELISSLDRLLHAIGHLANGHLGR